MDGYDDINDNATEEVEEEDYDYDFKHSEEELEKLIKNLEEEIEQTDKLREKNNKYYSTQINLQKECLQGILDVVPTIIYIRDAGGRLILVNKEMATFYSQPKENLIGKNLLEIHTDQKEAIEMRTSDQEVLQSRMRCIYQETITDSKGKRQAFLTMKNVFQLPNLQHDCILGISINSTEDMKLADELRDKQEQMQLEWLNRIRTMASLTHEVRTPLTGILCSATLLLDTQLSLAQRDNVTKIHRDSTAFLTMVGDVISFSQIEEIGLSLSEFSMPSLLSEALEYVDARVKEKNIHLDVEPYPSSSPGVFIGDKNRIWHVITNLLSNAIKFNTPSGHIKIRVSFMAQKEPPDSYYVSIAIRDTGTGMTDEQLQAIFNPMGSGSTLGLPISIKLAKMMNGNITAIRSDPGMTFTFNVPLQALRNDTSTPQVSRNYHGRPVLLVEDNLVNSKLLKRWLEKLKISVDVAENGKEALELLKNKKFDLIFMDLEMPVMDGFVATEHIRTTNKSLPIIALTATAIESIHAKCQEVGMNGIITKPIDYSTLIREMDRWFSRSNLYVF